MTPAAVLIALQVVVVWAAASGAQPESSGISGDEIKGAHSGICVVIRSYWAHGGAGSGHSTQPLRQLLTTLRQQSNPNWEAIIVVMDSKPFRDLHHIIQDLEDERVWVYAEWVGREHTPKMNGIWTGQYHEKLYNLTDNAIRACPSDTEWVVVTNGDNDYAPSFFDHISAATTHHDLIAFDFYSRYHRSSGLPCQRFGHQEGCPNCKRNKLRWCQTDLGANVMRWPRLIRENKRFGDLVGTQGSGAAEHFDGFMAQVMASEWPTQRVQQCLYNHSPSPPWCARSGGVWDDSDVRPGSIGGTCLDLKQASRRLQEGNGSIEEVSVSLTHDDYLTQFGEYPTQFRCLRQKDALQQRYDQMTYFGTVCSEDCDLGMFNTSDYKAAKARAEKVRAAAAAAAGAETKQVTAGGPIKPPPPPDSRNVTERSKPRYRDLFSDSCSAGGGGSCNLRL